jgi:murein DD-endopeptidase MepM/ murein hydrolase activator NlpD
MSTRRSSFTVLVARADGRFFRVTIGPRTLYSGLALLVLAVVGTSVGASDYAGLARQRQQVASLQQELVERQRRLDFDDARFAEIQKEIASWNDVQARIWRPLGESPAVTSASADATPPGQLLASVQDTGTRLRALERMVTRSARVLAAVPHGRPVRGQVNSGFGNRQSPWGEGTEFHRGVDLAVNTGTPVKATAPGVVSFAGSTPDYGNTVEVDHGSNIKTRFGHLQKIQTVAGQRVERGDQIALSGSTGRSTGPHLHYELILQGRPVDPKISFDE